MNKVEINIINFKLARLVKLKRQLIDKQMKELDLSRTQWQVLFVIKHLGVPCTQKAVLEQCDIDQAHLARTLEQLEKRYYINREPMPNNRRTLIINLSLTGKSFMKNIEKIMKKGDEVLLKGLNSKQKEQLLFLLEKLEKNLMSATSAQLKNERNLE